MNIISSVLAPKTYKYTLSVLILNLMTYEQDRLRKFKIATCCNRLHVFYLNGNDKLCFSVKLGVVLCITSYI